MSQAQLDHRYFLPTNEVLDVLRRALAAGANPDQVEALAVELGVATWMKKPKQEPQHEPIKSY